MDTGANTCIRTYIHVVECRDITYTVANTHIYTHTNNFDPYIHPFVIPKIVIQEMLNVQSMLQRPHRSAWESYDSTFAQAAHAS